MPSVKYTKFLGIEIKNAPLNFNLQAGNNSMMAAALLFQQNDFRTRHIALKLTLQDRACITSFRNSWVTKSLYQAEKFEKSAEKLT